MLSGAAAQLLPDFPAAAIVCCNDCPGLMTVKEKIKAMFRQRNEKYSELRV